MFFLLKSLFLLSFQWQWLEYTGKEIKIQPQILPYMGKHLCARQWFWQALDSELCLSQSLSGHLCLQSSVFTPDGFPIPVAIFGKQWFKLIQWHRCDIVNVTCANFQIWSLTEIHFDWNFAKSYLSATVNASSWNFAQSMTMLCAKFQNDLSTDIEGKVKEIWGDFFFVV